MMKMMGSMEPRKFLKGEIIYHDMEEVDELIFVVRGEYAIGYTVNAREYLALRLSTKTVIGDYAVMFQKRSEFLYKVLFDMDCQAIRKGKFLEIADKYSFFAQKLKIKTFQRYKDIVRKPVLDHKQETITQIMRINKFDF
jgi:CRP-like cAMP-binding protein